MISTGVAAVVTDSGLLDDPADEEVSSELDTEEESVELSTADDSVSDSVGDEVVEEDETSTDPADEETNSASVTATGSEVVDEIGKSVDSSLSVEGDSVSVDGFNELLDEPDSFVTSCPDPSSSVVKSTELSLDSVTETELWLDEDSGMTVVTTSSSSHSKSGQHLSGEKMGRQFGMWLGFSSHSTMTQRMMDDSQVHDCWQGLGTGTSAPLE